MKLTVPLGRMGLISISKDKFIIFDGDDKDQSGSITEYDIYQNKINIFNQKINNGNNLSLQPLL